MLLTELDLIAGRPRHKQAWDALLKWVVLRCSRQRTAHIPNVFHIAYQTVSEDKGTKMTYNVPHDRWDAEPIRLRVASLPFAEGGMRLAYRAREILKDNSEVDVVVKQWQLRGERPPDVSSQRQQHFAGPQVPHCA